MLGIDAALRSAGAQARDGEPAPSWMGDAGLNNDTAILVRDRRKVHFAPTTFRPLALTAAHLPTRLRACSACCCQLVLYTNTPSATT